mmetsp:Transcript_21026/g.25843  ORF Transcript_21026/g.25843 Transcript_21026/m.25843 type:complete len:83 (+) Transcript_21026:2621-2869(+)
MVQVIPENGKIETVVETKGDVRLSPVCAVESYSGQIYFVQEEISSQTSFIVKLSLKQDSKVNTWSKTSKKVFSLNSGRISVL